MFKKDSPQYLSRFIRTHGSSGFRLLLRILIHHWRAIVIGIFSLIIVDALQILVVPTVIQRTIDRLASGTANTNFLMYGGLAIAGAAIGMGIGRFAWRIFLVGTSTRIERDIRDFLYSHLLSLSAQYYDRQKIGDITAHVSNDTRAIQRACGFGTLAAIDGILMAAGVMTVMLYKNWFLTIFCLIPLPFLTLVVIRFGKIVHARFDRVQSAFSRITERAQEAFSAIRVVKAHGDEKSEEDYFQKHSQEYVDENIHLMKVWAIFDPMIMALAHVSMVLLIGIGGVMVIKGTLTLGEFVAFSTYLGMLIWPMIAIGVVVNHLQRGAASMDRIRKILLTEPAIVSGDTSIGQTPHIKITHLSYTFPETDTEVLHNISLTIEPGTFLGIVGRTGCGKTALLELIMRLYDPPEGTILYDETPLQSLRLDDIRKLFGYVPQDPFLFAMSVADNIRFGTPDLPDEEVEKYARLVRMHDEILTFPDGYNTRVGERGITLSGGQKQRISIARALAARPPILILDDALSSVDSETENALLKELASLPDDATRIVVAHRISAVKDADSIIVLDKGHIIDQGTHRDLIGRPGYYRDLFHLQSLEDQNHTG